MANKEFCRSDLFVICIGSVELLLHLQIIFSIHFTHTDPKNGWYPSLQRSHLWWRRSHFVQLLTAHVMQCCLLGCKKKPSWQLLQSSPPPTWYWLRQFEICGVQWPERRIKPAWHFSHSFLLSYEAIWQLGIVALRSWVSDSSILLAPSGVGIFILPDYSGIIYYSWFWSNRGSYEPPDRSIYGRSSISIKAYC